MRQITIMAMVDVASALADRSLAGNLYFIDNHRAGGSTHEGTEVLRTKVRKGDELIWMSHSLQAETFVEMSRIILCSDAESIELSRRCFGDTDVLLWIGKVKKDLEQPLPYMVDFRVGSGPLRMTTTRCPSLFGCQRLLGEGKREAELGEEEPVDEKAVDRQATDDRSANTETPGEKTAEEKAATAKAPKKPATGRARKRKTP